jgi:WD repeat-containing protein 35
MSASPPRALPTTTCAVRKWKAEQLENEHLRLLYLVSKYTSETTWIREMPLLVLLFEAIQEKVFSYDYAPDCVPVGERQVFMNVTQEGRDDIDDLRESGLLESLKLSTYSGLTMTAFKLSDAGRAFVDQVHEADRVLVDAVFQPDGSGGPLMEVIWNSEAGEFAVEVGAARWVSAVLDCEDVSYVCSPFVPDCLRTQQIPRCNSNAAQAHLSAEGTSNVLSDMNEVITLSRLTVMIGEWIPFGANQVPLPRILKPPGALQRHHLPASNPLS